MSNEGLMDFMTKPTTGVMMQEDVLDALLGEPHL
jgi:hypothetical protein